MASRRMTATPALTLCTLPEFKHQVLISVSKPLGAISLAIGATATLRSLLHGALLEALSVPIYPLLLALPAITVLAKQTQRTVAACYFSHILRSWALLAVGLELAPNAEAIRTILHIRIELILEALLCFQDQLSPWIMAVLHALRQLGWMSIIYTNMHYSLQHAIIRGILNWVFLMGMSCLFEYRTRKQYSRYIQHAHAAMDKTAGIKQSTSEPVVTDCKKDGIQDTGSPSNKKQLKGDHPPTYSPVKPCTVVRTLNSKPQQKPTLPGGYLDSNDTDVYDEWFSEDELTPPADARKPTADKHDDHRASSTQTTERPPHHTRLLDSFCPQPPQSAILPRTAYDPTTVLAQQTSAIAFFSLTNQTDFMESNRFPYDLSGSGTMRCDPYSADGSFLASAANRCASIQGNHNVGASKAMSMSALNEIQEPCSVLDVSQNMQSAWSNLPAVKCGASHDSYPPKHTAQTVDTSVSEPVRPSQHSRPAVDAPGVQHDGLGNACLTSSGKQQPSLHNVLKFMEAAKHAPYVSRNRRSTVCIKMKGIEPHQLPPQLIAELQDQLAAWNPSLQVQGSAVRAGCVIVTLDLVELSHISHPKKGAMEGVVADILSSALSHANLPEGTPATIQVGDQVSTMWWDDVLKQYVSQAIDQPLIPQPASLPGSRTGLHFHPIDAPLSELVLNSGHHGSSPMNVWGQLGPSSCNAVANGAGVSSLQERCQILTISQWVHVLDTNKSQTFSFTVLLMLPPDCLLSGWSTDSQKETKADVNMQQLKPQVYEGPTLPEVFLIARGQDRFHTVSVRETAERCSIPTKHAALAKAMVIVELATDFVAPAGLTIELWCKTTSTTDMHQSFGPPSSLYTTAQETPFKFSPRHDFPTETLMDMSEQNLLGQPRYAFELMHAHVPLLILSSGQDKASDELRLYMYKNQESNGTLTEAPRDTCDCLETLIAAEQLHTNIRHDLQHMTGSKHAQLGMSMMNTNGVATVGAAQLVSQHQSPSNQFLSDLGHWFNYSSTVQLSGTNRSSLDETMRGVGYDVLSHTVQHGLRALSQLLVGQLECVDRHLDEGSASISGSQKNASRWWLDVSLMDQNTAKQGNDGKHVMTGTATTWTQGNGLLHLAMLSGKPDMISTVLRWGHLYGSQAWCWDWGLQNTSGLTPLHIAATLGDACKPMMEAVAATLSLKQLENVSDMWYNSPGGIGHTPAEILSQSGVKLDSNLFSSTTCNTAPRDNCKPTSSLVCRVAAMVELLKQSMTDPPGYAAWLHDQLRPVVTVWRSLMLLMLASLLLRAAQLGRVSSDFPSLILCLGGYLPALLATIGNKTWLGNWQAWTLPLLMCRAASILLPSIGILPFPHSWAIGLSMRTELFFELLQTVAEQMPLSFLLTGRAAMTVACWRAYIIVSKPRPLYASLALNLACIPVAILCHIWQVQVFLSKRQLRSNQATSQANNCAVASGTGVGQIQKKKPENLNGDIRHIADGKSPKVDSIGNVLRQRSIMQKVLISHRE